MLFVINVIKLISHWGGGGVTHLVEIIIAFHLVVEMEGVQLGRTGSFDDLVKDVKVAFSDRLVTDAGLLQQIIKDHPTYWRTLANEEHTKVRAAHTTTNEPLVNFTSTNYGKSKYMYTHFIYI